MECKIIVTGIIKYKNKFLIIKRSDNDDFMPGSWEFPGGNLENNELIEEALKRELKEEIGFDLSNKTSKIINYSDEVKEKNNKIIHIVELDFLIECDNANFNIVLSNEHTDYKWVEKDSRLMDDFIKSKLNNL